jgi:hypothetical protein
LEVLHQEKRNNHIFVLNAYRVFDICNTGAKSGNQRPTRFTIHQLCGPRHPQVLIFIYPVLPATASTCTAQPVQNNVFHAYINQLWQFQCKPLIGEVLRSDLQIREEGFICKVNHSIRKPKDNSKY